MKYSHFCDCGPHVHCLEPIVHAICEECGNEYIGPECDVTNPLPVSVREDGRILCESCRQRAARQENGTVV